MKKFVLFFLILCLLSIAVLIWRVDLATKILYTYYVNIKLLDVNKDIVTNSKAKDGSYNFVYFLSAERIIESRKTWLGKIASDRIESRDEKFLDFRKKAEIYILRDIK